MPKLSIFITTYNRSAALADTLRRLRLLLADRDVEIIVFDDASTDDTPDVCRDASGVRCMRAERNAGYISARNRALNLTSAPFVLYLDDDSYPLDVTVVDRIPAVFAAEPRVAIIAGNIASRDQPQGLDDPTARPYLTASFIGCGHVIRRAAFPSAQLYPPYLIGYGSEEMALSISLLERQWSVMFDPGLQIYHAEDPTQRPSAKRMASLFANEIGTILARMPIALWLPLAIKKLLSHWIINWRGNSVAVLRHVVTSVPRTIPLALRDRRPISFQSLREFHRRRMDAVDRWKRWQVRQHAAPAAGSALPAQPSRHSASASGTPEERRV